MHSVVSNVDSPDHLPFTRISLFKHFSFKFTIELVSSCAQIALYLASAWLIIFLHTSMVISFYSKEGNVVISRVANFLLCIYSKQNIGIGMLRAKVTKHFIMIFVGIYRTTDGELS